MSDYYNQLAIDDAHSLPAPQTLCRSCGALVSAEEEVEGEFCGQKGCPDYEQLPQSRESMILLAMINLMTRRLAKTGVTSRLLTHPLRISL